MKTGAFFLCCVATFSTAFAESSRRAPAMNPRAVLLKRIQSLPGEIPIEQLRSLFQLSIGESIDDAIERALREAIAEKTLNETRALELWRKPLTEGSVYERRQALRILAEVPYSTPEISELIRPQFAQRDPYIRKYAAEYAGAVANPATFRAELLSLARTKDVKNSTAATEAARRAAVESLAKAMENDSQASLDTFLELAKEPSLQEEVVDGIAWLVERGQLRENADVILKATERLLTQKALVPKIFDIARQLGTSELSSALRFVLRTMDSVQANDVAKAYAARTAGDLLPLATPDYPERQLLKVRLLESVKSGSPLLASQAVRGLGAGFEQGTEAERNALVSAISKVTDHTSDLVRIQVTIALSRLGVPPLEDAVTEVFSIVSPRANVSTIEGVMAIDPSHVSVDNFTFLGTRVAAYVGDETAGEKGQAARARQLTDLMSRFASHPGFEPFTLAVLKPENAFVQETVFQHLKPEIGHLKRWEILKYFVTTKFEFPDKLPVLKRLHEIANETEDPSVHKSIVAIFREALHQDERTAATAARLSLALVSDAIARKNLVSDLLEDQRESVRIPAIEILEASDKLPVEMLPRLLRITVNGTPDAMRTEALLRKSSSLELSPVLQEMADNGNALQKRNLLRVSAKLSSDEVISLDETTDHAKRVIADRDENARYDAYQLALALTSGAEKSQLAVAALKDASPIVRNIALDVLPSFPEVTEEIETLQKNPKFRDIASHALEKIRGSSQRR